MITYQLPFSFAMQSQYQTREQLSFFLMYG
jgi:hypothetical protein